MNGIGPPQRRLRQLVDHMAVGMLSDSEHAELDNLVANDPACRKYYLERTFLVGKLFWQFGGSRRLEQPKDRRPAHGSHSSGVLGFLGEVLHTTYFSPRATMTILGGALACYFIVLFALIPLARLANETRTSALAENSAESKSDPKTPPSVAKRGKEVGTLATNRLARWTPESAPARPKVEVGKRYDLAGGMAEIILSRGTRIVVQAPAAWSFDSEQRLFLYGGRIAAHVPPAAVGFTVETPAASIVDLGTDFAVDVDSTGDTSLAVLRGAVSLAKRELGGDAATGGQSVRLAAGEAMTVTGRKSESWIVRPSPMDTSWAVAALASATLRTGRAIAYAVRSGTPGNQGYFHGSLGLDFDVEQPIRVFSLGVFDNLADGIDPESDLTVQLWSRDVGQMTDPGDDTGIEILAELSFSATDPGTLVSGHRFKLLAAPVDLAVGNYTILATGFSEKNPNVNFNLLAAEAPAQFDALEGAIRPAGNSRHNNGNFGHFPQTVDNGPIQYVAGSFQYELQEKAEPGRTD